ncbi:iron-hydroxamate ABC transporter substrate-binding protein [Clostridium sp.]|uniref:iron-hydroxamate ABC transporter substrate-binding protein n=1 Tax=Clostridium sp. TaxID=1506 RepID=UPI002A920BE1|nr:iron-hydroxamate ABC transporter substrate-binding protein [Clostridium sp.]MDY6011953.1 iron-hydroxamate ABC transporter substrate-binding protein [Clostridium sp.]
MKKTKSLLLLAVMMLSFGIFAGCSNNNSESKGENETRTVSSVKGDVEIPADPKRIVDISGSSEELIILGKTPVGTANIDSYDTTKVPSYIEDKLGNAKVVGHSMMDTMDIEAILSTNPDLIIMSERQEKIYDQLKEIAPVVMIKDYANDWRQKLTDVSKIFDEEDVAKKWLASYDEKAKKLGEEIKAKNGNQTYLPLLSTSGQFMVFSNAGIGSIIYDDMGLAKPANMPKQDSITLPTVTMEGLTKIDADHIAVIATEADKKDLAKSKVWNNTRAVKDGNVTILDASPYFTQGYNPIGREMLLESIKNELTK